MTGRVFPRGNFLGDPNIDFSVLPDYIADEFYVRGAGLSEALVDYYVEAEDSAGNIKRSPIQHVRVGSFHRHRNRPLHTGAGSMGKGRLRGRPETLSR